jgi:hypothetical protein
MASSISIFPIEGYLKTGIIFILPHGEVEPDRITVPIPKELSAWTK